MLLAKYLCGHSHILFSCFVVWKGSTTRKQPCQTTACKILSKPLIQAFRRSVIYLYSKPADQDPKTLTGCAFFMAVRSRALSSSITATHSWSKLSKKHSGTELEDHCYQGQKSPDSQRDWVMQLVKFKTRFSYLVPKAAGADNPLSEIHCP